MQSRARQIKTATGNEKGGKHGFVSSKRTLALLQKDRKKKQDKEIATNGVLSNFDTLLAES